MLSRSIQQARHPDLLGPELSTFEPLTGRSAAMCQDQEMLLVSPFRRIPVGSSIDIHANKATSSNNVPGTSCCHTSTFDPLFAQSSC